MTMKAVGTAAMEMVQEVEIQFDEARLFINATEVAAVLILASFCFCPLAVCCLRQYLHLQRQAIFQVCRVCKRQNRCFERYLTVSSCVHFAVWCIFHLFVFCASVGFWGFYNHGQSGQPNTVC